MFVGVVFFIILLSVSFDSWIAKICLIDFNDILVDNGICSELSQAIKEESSLFEIYIKKSGSETKQALSEAMERTRRAVDALPRSYEKIGELRYAKTWIVSSSYEVYCEKRDDVLAMRDRKSVV